MIPVQFPSYFGDPIVLINNCIILMHSIYFIDILNLVKREHEALQLFCNSNYQTPV